MLSKNYFFKGGLTFYELFLKMFLYSIILKLSGRDGYLSHSSFS